MVANPQNLRTPTTEEARRIGRKGGLASARARQERKRMAEVYEILLRMPLQDGPSGTLNGVESLSKERIREANPPAGELMGLAMLQQAIKGNVKAAKLILDITGDTIGTQTVSPLDGLAEELKRYKEEDERCRRQRAGWSSCAPTSSIHTRGIRGATRRRYPRWPRASGGSGSKRR